MKNPIQPAYIILERGEGPSELCDRPVAVKTWAQADEVLWQWAETAPLSGYDKVDFLVVWNDGELYQGRFDLRRQDGLYGNHLPRHIRQFAGVYAGERKPAHLSEERWNRFLETISPATREHYGKVLATYALPEVPEGQRAKP